MIVFNKGIFSYIELIIKVNVFLNNVKVIIYFSCTLLSTTEFVYLFLYIKFQLKCCHQYQDPKIKIKNIITHLLKIKSIKIIMNQFF